MVFRRIEHLGIDEHARFALVRTVIVFVIAVRMTRFRLGILVLGLEIDHQHAQRHADLNRGKADAGGIVHRVEHVGDERLEFVVERGDRG